MKTPTAIHIFADYGDAYAWVESASTILPPYFPDNSEIKVIDHDLQLWAGWFWKSLNNRETFPWAEFHARGLALATRLHKALPLEMDIEISYGRPTEDPQYIRGEQIIIRPRHHHPPAPPLKTP